MTLQGLAAVNYLGTLLKLISTQNTTLFQLMCQNTCAQQGFELPVVCIHVYNTHKNNCEKECESAKFKTSQNGLLNKSANFCARRYKNGAMHGDS